MSDVKTIRRALARIRLSEEGASLPRIGSRPLHHFWPLLADAFRAVLMPPHHRTDEEAVSWSWREAEEAMPPSPAELEEIRRELRGAQERFARAVAEGRVGRGGGATSQRLAGSAEQLEAVMAAVVRELVDQPDLALAGYVARTDSGLRVHSWGAATPAKPSYPDPRGLEISGRILVAGKPARHDVVLESSDGETIAEVPSDEAGEFFFSKLSPGEYVLRARSVRGTFPPRGLPVELQQQSVKGLVLADGRAEAVSPLVSARRAGSRRSRRTVPLIVAGVIVVAGAGWAWRSLGSDPERVAAQTAVEAGRDRSLPPSTEPRTVASSTGSAPGVREDSAAGPGLRSLPGPGAGELSPARAGLEVEGRERDPSLVPMGSGSGGAGIGGPSGPANGGAGGAPAARSSREVSLDVAGSTPAVPGPESGPNGGGPAGRPEVPASGPAPVAAGAIPPSTPAAAASVSSPGGPGTSGSGPVAPVPVASANLESPAPPSAKLESTSVPVALETGTSVVPANPVADEAIVAQPRAEPGRDVHSETPSTTIAVLPEPAVVAADSVPGSEPEQPLVPPPLPVAETLRPWVPPVVRAPPVSLTRTLRIRVSPWQPRLLVDTILPTEPLPLSRSESLEVIRARLQAEQEARFPGELRDPSARWGVALDLPSTWELGALGWLDSAGAPVPGASLSGNRAALLWPAEADGAERSYRLVRPDGSPVAEVNVSASGRDLTVRTSEETRARFLLSVRTGNPNTPEAGPAAADRGFTWRSVASADLPASWRESGGAAPGERVVEVPLGALPGAVALQAAALLDPETGWAIVTDVRQAADRALGR